MESARRPYGTFENTRSKSGLSGCTAKLPNAWELWSRRDVRFRFREVLDVVSRQWRSEVTFAVAGAVLALLVIIYMGFAINFKVVTVRVAVPVGNATTMTTVQFLQYQGSSSSALLEVLLSTAGVMGSVLTVAFGISQFFIGSIADKYSPRMLVFFRANLKYRAAYALVFVSTVIFVAMLLISPSMNAALSFLVGVAMVVLFVASLIAFLFYYAYIYEVLNPLTFCATVEKMVLRSITVPHDVENGVAAIADSAVKSIVRRGEEENVKAFIDSLANIAEEASRASANGAPAFTRVMDQIERINETAQRERDFEITRHLFLKIRRIGIKVIGSSS